MRPRTHSIVAAALLAANCLSATGCLTIAGFGIGTVAPVRTNPRTVRLARQSLPPGAAVRVRFASPATVRAVLPNGEGVVLGEVASASGRLQSAGTDTAWLEASEVRDARGARRRFSPPDAPRLALAADAPIGVDVLSLDAGRRERLVRRATVVGLVLDVVWIVLLLSSEEGNT